jgi:hypothetical protein
MKSSHSGDEAHCAFVGEQSSSEFPQGDNIVEDLGVRCEGRGATESDGSGEVPPVIADGRAGEEAQEAVG